MGGIQLTSSTTASLSAPRTTLAALPMIRPMLMMKTQTPQRSLAALLMAEPVSSPSDILELRMTNARQGALGGHGARRAPPPWDSPSPGLSATPTATEESRLQSCLLNQNQFNQVLDED